MHKRPQFLRAAIEVAAILLGLSSLASNAADTTLTLPTPFDFTKCPRPDYPAAAVRTEATGTIVVAYALALDAKLAWATVEQSTGRTREHKMLDRVALSTIAECIGQSAFTSLTEYPITGRIAVSFTGTGADSQSSWQRQPTPTLSEPDRARLQKIMAETVAQAQEMQRSKREAELAEYRKLYSQIRTLEDVYLFEKSFRDDDPDKLIPRLSERKAKLRLERYRQEYQEASDATLLRLFIFNYENDDPDKLIASARQKLTVALRTESEERARKIRMEKEAATARRSESLEAEIRQCRRIIESATTIINREKEIGRVSGYENAGALHTAGKQIVDCRTRIAELYSVYRENGGSRRLDEIR